MGQVMDERLIYEILSVVEEIPAGRVATYGQIARLIGRERNARLVGRTHLTTVSSPATGWSTTPDAWRRGGRSSGPFWRTSG